MTIAADLVRPLSTNAANPLGQVRYASVATVVVAYPRAAVRQIRGLVVPFLFTAVRAFMVWRRRPRPGAISMIELGGFVLIAPGPVPASAPMSPVDDGVQITPMGRPVSITR